MKYVRVKVWLYDATWHGVILLSSLLLAYKKPGSIRHRLVTCVFFLLLQLSERADDMFIKELQNRRLRRLLICAEKIPFWQDYFKAHGFRVDKVLSSACLMSLPPTTKKSFIGIDRLRCIQGFLYEDERILRHRTSGTTGVPFEWGIDKNVWFVEITAYFYRALSWYGGYKKLLSPKIATFVFNSYSVPSTEIYWHPAGKEARAHFKKLIRSLSDLAPRVLFAYPTNLLLFAKFSISENDKIPFSTIVTTGQTLEDEYRLYIEKALRSRVASLYGARELGQMAVECPQNRHWYHINSERLILEILNDDGSPVQSGQEGNITLTCLDNLAMPLIRYQLGDRGRFVSEKCACGCRHVLFEFKGREMGFVRLPNGGVIPFRHLNSIILSRYFEGLLAYQVVQVASDVFVFKYQPTQKWTVQSASMLEDDFKNCLGYSVVVRFEVSDDLFVSGKKTEQFIPLTGSGSA